MNYLDALPSEYILHDSFIPFGMHGAWHIIIAELFVEQINE